MKKAFFIPLLLTAAISQTVVAQSQKQYAVKAGESVLLAIPARERYLLPSFQNGGVFYKDGEHTPRLKMNFNSLAGVLAFIDQKGDTLAFTKNTDIDFATIGNELFIYDKRYGFINVIRKQDSVKLGNQQQWDIIRKESARGDGYGYVTQTSGQRSTLTQRGTNFQTIVNENTVFGMEDHYFLIGKNQKVYFASKSGFSAAFPSIKELIKSYYLDNGEFTMNKDYIEKLYTYCITTVREKMKLDTRIN